MICAAKILQEAYIMQHVDFKKVFTLAGMTGKCESLSITIDDGKVIEVGSENWTVS